MSKVLLTAVAAVATAALVGGCTSSTSGSGSPVTSVGSSTTATAATSSGNATIAPAEVGQKVRAAMAAAESFHMVGSGIDSGKRLAFDIHFGPHKTDGSITQDTQKIELINPGGASVYFRLPDELWRQFAGEGAVAIFSGKWVQVPSKDSRFASLAKSFDKDEFLGGLTDDSSSDDLKLVGPATVDGTAATKYKASDGSEIYVAASGPPVLLKIVDSSSTGGTVTFSDYGKAYPFAPPPASQTIDFSKLGH